MTHRIFLLFILSFFTGIQLAHAIPDDGNRGGQCEADDFYQKLGQCESGAGKKQDCIGADKADQYSRVNKIGCIGKYQFCPSTLAKYTNDPDEFLRNPAMQERIMRENTSANDRSLQKSGAYNYIGQVRNGVTITKSGLLAAAHLGGAEGASRWAKSGYNPDDGNTTLAEYASLMGGYNILGSGTDGSCGFAPPPEALESDGTFNRALIGCDPAIKEGATAKADALRQQETEAAKALITKPASVQQLTCFDQYAQLNADSIGRIHSDPPQGISDTITPNVEQPNIQHVIQNFMSDILSGGLQSMLNSAMGGLTGGMGGGGSGGCNAMDEMWDIMQCIDFPEMPSLSDIMGGGSGGGGDMLGGILSGLGGGEGGLGSLGSGGGGGGIMGAVCQAMNDAFGGGGSGGTDAFENLADSLAEEGDDNSDLYDQDAVEELRDAIQDTVNGDTDACDYAGIAAMMANMDADLDGDNIIEEDELSTIDVDFGDSDCVIEDQEIEDARAGDID